MTREQIIEGNKLIAEFDGSMVIRKYHEDWNNLMRVVDKIIGIDITPAPNYTGYRIEIVPRGYVKISGFPMPTITTNVSIEGSLINATYKAVYQFIAYYNSLNK